MYNRRITDRRLLTNARNMRKSPTDAEKKLWSILRSRALCGFKFRRQHPIGGHVLDFYCVESHLAIELDGSQHADADALENDAQRTRRLAELGVRVIRFWNHELLTQPYEVGERILEELQKPSGHPSSGPSPQPSVAAATEGA
jgi:very-short-patch-repair endonuclease